ncbi:N-acetylmuramoyl-L-alanine amidase [Cryobacterium sp. Sr8]|uniref:peptidoglycan recognition protein family protein n=1 Tax=Cryobacterium sp. Sr8 TaxID=1259203 RepID=UPI00106B4ECD|nr:peptidoglycan recognition family protein [Cryobacterium sp. Sr8]TFD80718.1 N-acetylmuramoyl-L-alanine amidase [Cryobacterium sp. Sr8]
MPTFSHLTTRTVSTMNSSTRFGARPRYIVLHHMASTGFEGVLSLWSAARKQGSAHYAISNAGQVVGVVPEERRAWSLSSAAFDSKAIVFEIANQSMGGTWPVSAAAEEATARVVADICTRYGIPITRDRIIGHREVFARFHAGYATACPGGLNLDGIVARAKALAAGTVPPAVKPAGIVKRAVKAVRPKPKAWRLVLPSRTVAKRIQRALAKRGRYAGAIDGVFGVLSYKGIQKTLAVGAGYTGPIDGAIGIVGARLIQTYAAKFGRYKGTIDGDLGAFSWAGFAAGLE